MPKTYVRCGVFIILGAMVMFSAVAQVFEGTFSIFFIDDFKNNKSSQVIQLRQKDKLYELYFEDINTSSQYKTGDLVSLDGTLTKDNRIKVKTIRLIKHRS